jgi:membrane protein
VLGTVGLLFLLFTVVSLIQKIEQAFNATWRVAGSRSLGQRFSNYLSVILVGPLLLVSALGLTATMTHVRGVEEVVVMIGPVLDFAGRLLPYLLVIGAFTFVYVLVPNTRVRPVSALAGAVVAGILWESTGWAFTAFVAGSTNYTAIYSAFATMILFMIWLFLSWLILLVGASFAFYHQHPEYLFHGPARPRLSSRQHERFALGIVYLLGRSFQRGEAAPCAFELARRLRMPELLVQSLLDALERGGLVYRTAAEPPGYTPARAAERIALHEVLDCVRATGEVLKRSKRRDADLEPVDALLDEVRRAVLGRLDGATLADLVASEGRAGPEETEPPQAGQESAAR